MRIATKMRGLYMDIPESLLEEQPAGKPEGQATPSAESSPGASRLSNWERSLARHGLCT